MAIPQPGAAEGYSGYLKTDEYQGYNTLTGSNAVPVGYISGGTLLMLFLKGKHMTTARLQCSESSTATGFLTLGIPSTKKYLGDYEKRKQLRLEKEKSSIIVVK